jgi:hypothetical protein
MKKSKKKDVISEMRPEYDFSDGVRGRYASRAAEGSNVVVLDPDMAEIFEDSEAVNRALRTVAPTTPRNRTRKDPTRAKSSR